MFLIVLAFICLSVSVGNSILVMDRGQVAEYDTPHSLLKNPQSLFSKMVDETGEANAALLRSLAGC